MLLELEPLVPTGLNCTPIDAMDAICQRHDIDYRGCYSIITGFFGECVQITAPADEKLCYDARNTESSFTVGSDGYALQFRNSRNILYMLLN